MIVDHGISMSALAIDSRALNDSNDIGARLNTLRESTFTGDPLFSISMNKAPSMEAYGSIQKYLTRV